MDAHEAPTSSPDDALVGRTLGGHYRIEGRIGGGAMGSVYRARHTLLDQEFAVKVLASGVSADPEVRRRFLLEARSLTLFVHRNAVQVRHCGEDDGLLYLAMDLCPGETLSSLLDREGALPARRAAAIAVQVLDALDEAHLAGIVHRDLKPGNVMVETTTLPDGSKEDRVRVVDFGLARIVDAERVALPAAYASVGGSVVGTVVYMSPEQLRAEEDVDGRSDLFSVGVVLYEMLAGDIPFGGTSTMSIAVSILEREPSAWPEGVGGGVDGPLRAVVARALEKDRNRRFQSAGEFAEAIRGALAGIEPIPLPPPPPPPAPAPPTKKPRKKALVLSACAVALAAAATVFFASRDEPTAERERRAAGAALAEGRWAQAVEAYGKAIDAGARTGEDYLARAKARTELNDVNARQDLDQATILLSQDPRVPTLYGRFLHRVAKDEAGADSRFVMALSFDPKNADARSERIRTEIDRKNWAGAAHDLDLLRRDAPDDARVPLLASRLDLRLADEEPDAVKKPAPETGVGENAKKSALQASGKENARAAVAKDERSADASSTLADALQARGVSERLRGENASARKLFEAAVVAAGDAIEKAHRWPSHDAQGSRLSDMHRMRGGMKYALEDFQGALEDLEESLRLQPRNADALANRAFANQQAGNAEAAIADFERLYEITGLAEHLFRQGFGWQSLGAGRADVGDSAGAIADYDKAVALYRQGVDRHPKDVSMPTYLGETLTARATLRSGDARREDLEAAKDAFARALTIAPGDPGGREALLRRAEWALVAHLPRPALDDARKSVDGRKGLWPRYYQTLARACLAVVDSGPVSPPEDASALLDEAIEMTTSAIERMPDVAARSLAMRATARRRKAMLPAFDAKPEERKVLLDAAIADLDAAAAQAQASKDTDVRVRGAALVAFRRAEIYLAMDRNAEALASAEEGMSLRATEAKAGRWYLDREWYLDLARWKRDAGDPAGSEAASAIADSLPH